MAEIAIKHVSIWLGIIRVAVPTFHLLVAILAFTLLILSTVDVFAQGAARNVVSNFEIERRISMLENVDAATRLAVVERIVDDINRRLEKSPIDYMSQGGIGLLLLKALFDVNAKKKGPNNETLN